MNPSFCKPVAGKSDGSGLSASSSASALTSASTLSSVRVGILALQGDFEAHGRAIKDLGSQPVYVRHPNELAGIDGLIIPGGESTTMLKLLQDEGLFAPIIQFAEQHPVMGTCAGSILMAEEVLSPAQKSFGLIAMTVERNAYGRQADSSIRSIEPSPQFAERTEPGRVEAVFIRAPMIRNVGAAASVLLSDGSDPVLVEHGRHLAATFHPELSKDRRLHTLFLDKIRSSR